MIVPYVSGTFSDNLLEGSLVKDITMMGKQEKQISLTLLSKEALSLPHS